jgi:dTDP-4-amino-4,6-dideoxygalactose transaminase
LPRLGSERARIARGLHRERLQGLPCVQRSEGETHVYHLFQVRTRARDALLAHLREREIDAVVRYPTPIHLQPAFASKGWKQGQFPVAEALSRELLCLPIRPDISLEEVDYVCGCVCEFFEARG